MKTLQIIFQKSQLLIPVCLFLLTPFLLSANHQLDGIWINPIDHKTVKIVSKSNCIKAKYLSDHDWERFYPVGRLTFKDKWGNYIKLVNNHTFKYYNTRNSSPRIFKKDGYVGYRPNNIKVTSIEGQWFASSIGKKVIVEKTELGLRSKILGDEYDWAYYRKERGKYIDRNGNMLDVKNANKLIWVSADRRSSVVMKR